MIEPYASLLEIADRDQWGVRCRQGPVAGSQPGPPLMLQQLRLLRPHIPAGQAHFTLITCADLRAEQARREPYH